MTARAFVTIRVNRAGLPEEYNELAPMSVASDLSALPQL